MTIYISYVLLEPSPLVRQHNHAALCECYSDCCGRVSLFAPRFGGPLGLANLTWCMFCFGWTSSWRNSEVSSFPLSISIYNNNKNTNYNGRYTYIATLIKRLHWGEGGEWNKLWWVIGWKKKKIWPHEWLGNNFLFNI